MDAVKLQISCLLVTLFIAGIYFPVKRKKTHSHIIFSVSLWTCIFCLIFDIISVYTVNHLETVPPVVNRIVHNLFMGSLIMEVGMCYEYCLVLIHNDRISKKRLWVSAIPVWIAWIGLVTAGSGVTWRRNSCVGWRMPIAWLLSAPMEPGMRRLIS